MDYVIYVADTETTGLSAYEHDVIELSLYRLTDDAQKTWLLKPTKPEAIDPGALRINGHKIEDITHLTKHGRENYQDPNKTIVEIENWMSEDCVPAEQRILVGQNVSFDKNMLEQLWTKCKSRDTFPFGRKSLDTLSIQFFMDWCIGEMAEGYSLSNLVKRYGVKNDRAHSAASDTKATKEVFLKQVAAFKKVLNVKNTVFSGS